MGLETPTYVQDFVATNPDGGDAKSHGDDHIRNIKSALKATFPNATHAWYFPNSTTSKTGIVNVVAGDASKVFPCDASGGSMTVNLPANAGLYDGWECLIGKTDSSANTVTIDGNGSDTINGGLTLVLTAQYDIVRLIWCSGISAWIGLRGLSAASIALTQIDITGGVALADADAADKIPIWDASVAANRQVLVSNLFKAIDTLTVDTSPALADEIVTYDASATLAKKVALPDFLKIINLLTEDTSPDTANDFVVTYDTSASGPKKAKPSVLAPSQKYVNRVYSTYTANASLSTAIPFDDTVPTSSEGTEIVTVSITPSSVTNRIRVTFRGFVVCSPGCCSLSQAAVTLFQDAGASAIAVSAVSPSQQNPQNITLTHEYVPGTTSPITLRIRAGSNTGFIRFNGHTGGRYFGGIAAATLVVEEITP